MTEKTEMTRTADEQQPAPGTRDETRMLTPPVDIFEVEEGLAVVVDLPGVPKENVDVNVENGVLTIQGKVDAQTEGDVIWREFDLMTYYRQFQLGEQVDQARIQADMKYGVLTIRLPKVEAAQPRKIEVNVAQ